MKPKTPDKTGLRFGRLTVTRLHHHKVFPGGRKRPMWLCKCDCGKESVVVSGALTNGTTSSCGCFGIERRVAATSTHRQSKTPAHNSWRGMMERCYNANHRQYKDYGGRGIQVCERWHNASNFLSDMGPPLGKTIERIEKHGNYTSENCKWATRTEQARNKRNNRMIEFNGETLCMAEWAERTGLGYAALQTRLDRGWSVERAMTTPKKTAR